MSISFQPNIIRRDSSVPLRMMAAGWAVGVLAVIVENPTGNAFGPLVGVTSFAWGLIAMTLLPDRTVRMVMGSVAGLLGLWLGYRYAIDDRLDPILRHDRGALAERARVGEIALGLSVLVIGLGGVLEALRAQAQSGQAPVPVRIGLAVLGMIVVWVVCREAGVSGGITVLVVVAAGAALIAMAWLRAERPPEEFQPLP